MVHPFPFSPEEYFFRLFETDMSGRRAKAVSKIISAHKG
jgi:hypothetical protein